MADRLFQVDGRKDVDYLIFTVTYTFDGNTGLVKEVEASNAWQAGVAFGAWMSYREEIRWSVTSIEPRPRVLRATQ